MKIRMKHNHAVVEEVGEVIVNFGDTCMQMAYSRKGMRDGQWEVFVDTEWEPVPEPAWQDVTADCKFHDGRMWHTPAFSIATLLPSNGYRVRQVPVSFTGKGIQNGCQPGCAFIVESQI